MNAHADSDKVFLRRADERGHARLAWLNSRHTFSFGDYHDPRYMGVGPLRVINEDIVAPGQGFGTHGHRDMEIISYVIEGELAHKDSLGTGSTIVPGDLQRMSAGTGVRHSEFNASHSAPVHFLQIWVLPRAAGLAPGYEQRSFSREARHNRLCLVGSADGREDSITIAQDITLYAGLLDASVTVQLTPAASQHVWLQMVKGEADCAGVQVAAGDGLFLVSPGVLEIRARQDAEMLLFEFP